MVFIFFFTGIFFAFFSPMTKASHIDLNRAGDSDHDGLIDVEESHYGTNPQNPDTDGDGYEDGNEVFHGYDPLVLGLDGPRKGRLPKRIDVDLSEQRLRYYYGEFGEQRNFLISSGIKHLPTPKGTFQVLKKRPVVHYKGPGYDYPNAKWNLQFKTGYYIHGAYWHNSFGTPVSHGCVNVPYSEMEKLYEFADEGTKVTIHE